jgi:hypothetical protein
LQRQVRSLAFQKVLILQVTYGEYRARCGCCATFRNSPPGVEPRAQYDNQVRQSVLDRIFEDGMSVEALRAAMKRDFYLDLSEGFVYDCLHREVARLDMADYRRWALHQFAGTLCVDELHLGKYTLLLATDPVADFPVAFALVKRNDQDHLRRFLNNLKTWGFSPQTVITDRSPLYPAVLAEVWPQAQHQLCVFHVLEDVTDEVLDAVKRYRRELARRGNRGRRRRRGRPKKQARRKMTRKQQAQFVYKHRYLLVKRPEKLSEGDFARLRTMYGDLPALQTLRMFMTQIYELFSPEQTRRAAGHRRGALVRNATYQGVPELSRVLAMLSPEQFEKMVAYLRRPYFCRIRTNNHVERTNRKLRFFEKVRYKWRRRRAIVRFLVIALARWRAAQTPPEPASPPDQKAPRNQRKTCEKGSCALSA